MLTFRNVSKQFPDGTVAVDDVTFTVPRREFCVILGASGAGKSTLLRMVNGLQQPTKGTVSVDGVMVTPKSLMALRPRMAMVHQQFNLVPRMSVLNNVASGALPSTSTLRALLGFFPQQYRRRTCELLQQVGLTESHLYRRVADLSGGQQQRVAIARAFILEPTVVLADEPVASLDPATGRNTLGLLHRASEHFGTTVICSMHQVELAKEFADRIVGLDGGRKVFDGNPDDFDQSAIQKLYANANGRAVDNFTAESSSAVVENQLTPPPVMVRTS